MERQTTDRGVVSHLVRSHRRVDLHAMLISVGLNVSNTNPPAYYPMQTFIMCGTVIATAPCHRGENDALLVQLRGSKEMLIHPPALVIPGCPASVCGDAAAASNPRWLCPFGPFQLPLSDSSLYVKVVMVPGDAVVVPKEWWHAVRSTPSSVATSVPVRLETTDERMVGRRTCRRDAQPAPVVRGAPDLPASEQMPNSRRTDNSFGADDPIAYYYALSDELLAESCRTAYERLEGHVITWHTGDDLMRFADIAAADPGLGAQQTVALDGCQVFSRGRSREGSCWRRRAVLRRTARRP